MSDAALPKSVTVPPRMGLPNCPWCSQDITDAQVRLGDLLDANQDDMLYHALRADDGTAAAGALMLSCPACERPSVLRLWSRGVGSEQEGWAQLIPVRTAKDVRFLAQEPAHD